MSKSDFKSLIGKPLERAFKLSKDAIDVATRTAKQMAITSDEPILHWLNGRGIAYVILDHAEKSINFERLKASAPFLENHDPDKRLGRLRNPVTDGHILRIDGRFSSRPYADEIFREVVEDLEHGDSPGTSTGFTIERIAEKIESYIDGIPVVRAIRWTPYEASLASMEADLRTGIGRCIGDDMEQSRSANDDADEDEDPAEEADESVDEEDAEEADEEDSPPAKRGKRSTNHTPRSKSMPDKEKETPKPAPTAAQLLQARTTEFVDTAALFGETEEQKTSFRTLARTLALDDAKTIDDLKRDILEVMKASQTSLQHEDPQSQAARQAGVVEFSYVSKPRHFKGDKAAERAYRFANWMLAGPLSEVRGGKGANGAHPLVIRAETYCRDHGILVRGQVENINESGGYTVPHEFGNDLIDLREEYGVFRRNAKIVPMVSDSRSDPRRDGGLTAYWEDETDALVASQKAWSRVGLKAKKLTVLDRFSSEINEDSLVNMGDDLAGEIAYAFALKEDNAGFNGDGTSAHGGITGVTQKLKGLSGTIANIAGLVVATGTGYGSSYGSIVLKDFNKTKAKLPAYALNRGPKWYFHQSFWSEVVESLVLAVGGVTAMEVAAGMPPRLLGYPVVIAQVLPSVSAVSQVVGLFGVLDLAARLGDRRQTTISLSDQVYWTTDEIGIKGTERLDIVVHDVGNADATAANRVPGPVVGLITAAS